MSSTALQGLLDYLTCTLSRKNRVWLAEHLMMPDQVMETPNQKYFRESLTRAIKEVRQAENEGREPGRPIEELLAEL